MKVPFVKYQGAGNDFILIDDRDGRIGPMLTTASIAQACDRHFGIGADGVILLQKSEDGADFFMKYYNSDGRTSSFCGNGGRCTAAFAASLGIHQGATKFLGTDGVHFAQTDRSGDISLSMSDVNAVDEMDTDTYILNTGSPHYVHFTHDIDHIDVFKEGRRIRKSEPFSPDGINVNFVEILAPGEIKIRTYERGVENETLAWCTGVVASAIASAFSKYPAVHTWTVQAVGGKLRVDFDHREGASFTNVHLTGPAVEVFKGELQFED